MDYAVGRPKVGFAYKSRMSCEVCFWPETDMVASAADDRFRGQSGLAADGQRWLQLTLSGPATVAERIASFKVDLDGRVSNAMLFQSLRQEWRDAFCHCERLQDLPYNPR